MWLVLDVARALEERGLRTVGGAPALTPLGTLEECPVGLKP